MSKPVSEREKEQDDVYYGSKGVYFDWHGLAEDLKDGLKPVKAQIDADYDIKNHSNKWKQHYKEALLEKEAEPEIKYYSDEDEIEKDDDIVFEKEDLDKEFQDRERKERVRDGQRLRGQQSMEDMVVDDGPMRFSADGGQELMIDGESPEQIIDAEELGVLGNEIKREPIVLKSMNKPYTRT